MTRSMGHSRTWPPLASVTQEMKDLYFAKCLLSAVLLLVRMNPYNGGMLAHHYMGSEARGYSLSTPAAQQEPELKASSSSLLKVCSEDQQPRALPEACWRCEIPALPLTHFLFTNSDTAGAS